MAKHFLAMLIVVALLLFPGQTPAQMNSAVYLAMQCNHATMGVASVEAAVCLNYLLGIVGGANLDRSMFCPGGDMISGQVAALYVQYVRDHPELSRENRITAAYAALKAAMPCGPGGNPPIPRRRPSDPVEPRDTAQTLLMDCNAINRNPVVCMNYLIGVVDGANIDRVMFCPTANSAGQLPWIYQKYVSAHPELLNRHRVEAVRAAFNEAFPCRQ